MSFLALIGCEQENAGSSPTAPPIRAPNVLPTHQDSFALMSAEEPVRLESLRTTIVSARRPCSKVTAATLIGALDGTDLWQVTCVDTGVWELWLRSDGLVDVAR